jgi:enoyl-CoA hydratase/carnithine racemase
MIERDEVDGIAIVRLAHGKVNALDLEMVTAIAETFREIDAGPYRGVVLTGSGRAFSAGVDLWRVVESGPDDVRTYLPGLVAAFEAVFTVGKPAVAAVNGHAIAGGAILVSGCDRRLMAAGAGRIGVSELLVGVPFPASALEIVRFALGPVRAREAVLTGATYDPEAALAHGFVDEVVAEGELLERAVAAADRLATVPADTFRFTKRQLRQDALDRIAARRDEDARVAELWTAGIADGRIRAYMQAATRRAASD